MGKKKGRIGVGGGSGENNLQLFCCFAKKKNFFFFYQQNNDLFFLFYYGNRLIQTGFRSRFFTSSLPSPPLFVLGSKEVDNMADEKR